MMSDIPTGAELMDYPDYPLFPLSSVVFPGGIMPLRIFEPRYMDMVRICTKSQTGFGVCALESGNGVGNENSPRSIGTLAEIIDFDQLDDGLLGITAEGKRRFEILSKRRAENGLWWGTVRFLKEQDDAPCPQEYAALQHVLEAIYDNLGEPYASRPRDFKSAAWISARLTELLPFDPATKHNLLATPDPIERLRQIQPLVKIQ